MNWLKNFVIIMGVLLILAAALLYKGDLPISYVDAKYSNDASQFLTMNNGTRVHFRDQGDKSKPAIVLLHGSNASLHTWEPWVQWLREDYRIVSLDFPGHGLTGATPDEDYSSEAQLKTVAAVVKHLQLDKFTLGGNSMGGGVTWRYTLKYPQQVTAMVLVDASGLPQFSRQDPLADNKSNKKQSPVFFKLMASPIASKLIRYVDPYWLTKQGVKSAYNNSAVVTDALIDRFYELALREGSRDATLSRFKGYSSRNNTPVDANQFKVPTLIMWGKEDSVIPVHYAHQFADALNNHTLIIYENVGHSPMEEIPALSAKDLLNFLTKS